MNSNITDDNSLIHAYILDGKGGGHRIGWDELSQWKPRQGILWVHLNFTSERTLQWLSNEAQLDPLAIQALTLDESRPRCTVLDKGLLLILRGVNHNPGQDPEDMVSIRLWMDHHRVISTRRRKLLSIQDLCDSFTNGRGPKTSADILTMLNDHLTERMSGSIEQLDDEVDEIDTELMTSSNYLMRSRVSDARQQIILIRRYLSPQREALRRLHSESNQFIDKGNQYKIRETNDRLIRYIEDLDSARDRATIIQEELTNRLAEQMNSRMYSLSLVALIFLPLSFITGLLGINVGGIPGANHRWGFSIVCVTLLVISIAMIWVLRKKKWI